MGKMPEAQNFLIPPRSNWNINCHQTLDSPTATDAPNKLLAVLDDNNWNIDLFSLFPKGELTSFFF